MSCLSFRGGGNVHNPGIDRSRPPLRWMVFQAGALGLRTKPFERELARHEQINIIESLTPGWWLLELCCLHRLTYTRRTDGKRRLISKYKGLPAEKSETSHLGGSVPLMSELGELRAPHIRKDGRIRIPFLT